jgi:hypothetical protein
MAGMKGANENPPADLDAARYAVVDVHIVKERCASRTSPSAAPHPDSVPYPQGRPYYVNAHTGEFPLGALRGQLVRTLPF